VGWKEEGGFKGNTGEKLSVPGKHEGVCTKLKIHILWRVRRRKDPRDLNPTHPYPLMIDCGGGWGGLQRGTEQSRNRGLLGEGGGGEPISSMSTLKQGVLNWGEGGK